MKERAIRNLKSDVTTKDKVIWFGGLTLAIISESIYRIYPLFS